MMTSVGPFLRPAVFGGRGQSPHPRPMLNLARSTFAARSGFARPRRNGWDKKPHSNSSWSREARPDFERLLDAVRRSPYPCCRTHVRLTTRPLEADMLTGRQQEIWDFLVDYVDRHGYPPTVREIGEAVGLASPSTVHAHLANLERGGLLKRDPTKPRALELVGREP